MEMLTICSVWLLTPKIVYTKLTDNLACRWPVVARKTRKLKEPILAAARWITARLPNLNTRWRIHMAVSLSQNYVTLFDAVKQAFQATQMLAGTCRTWRRR